MVTALVRDRRWEAVNTPNMLEGEHRGNHVGSQQTTVDGSVNRDANETANRRHRRW